MSTIAFATIDDANQRSREWWVSVLGRDKYAQDVTEYAYSRLADEDGTNPRIVINQRDAMLDGLIRQDQMTADEIAALVDLYPAWSASAAYAPDDLVAYADSLYKCVQGHTAQSDWTPTATPALWTHAAPAGVLPLWVQPTGAHNSYSIGDRVIWPEGGNVWESLINGNVWEPGSPGTESLWQLVDE